jgi:hypothetical protein
MLPRCHPAVENRDTHVGLGVFARQRFRRYQIIGDICGHVIDDDAYDSPYCMELNGGRVLEPTGVFRYLNHSCMPNCEIFYYEPVTDDDEESQPDRLWLKALRPIAAGDQLTIDYAWPAASAIPCRCLSPDCRGWIVAADELRDIADRETTPLSYTK